MSGAGIPPGSESAIRVIEPIVDAHHIGAVEHDGVADVIKGPEHHQVAGVLVGQIT
jgi:hypothetical protein